VAASFPELLEAYFAVSPMIYQLESERCSLSWMLDKAKETQDQRELDELGTIQLPFQNGSQLYFHRKWLAREMGTRFPSRLFVETWSGKWLALFNEASRVNFFEVAPEIKCPLYFFVGVNDYQTHFKLTEAYFHAVKAEKKELFWFSNSAHNLNLTEPEKLQHIIISILTEKN
jgi:pimeloyl-ACP methyl ester carboxylesterase